MPRKKKKQLEIPMTFEQKKAKLLAEAEQRFQSAKTQETIRDASLREREMCHVQLATLLLEIKLTQGWTYVDLSNALGSVCGPEMLNCLVLRYKYASKPVFTRIRDAALSCAKELRIRHSDVGIWADWRDM
jgi:hypothetical protein